MRTARSRRYRLSPEGFSSDQAHLVWGEVGAPYESARARAGVAQALLALGDRSGAVMELEVARATFDRLGALPDLASVSDWLEA